MALSQGSRLIVSRLPQALVDAIKELRLGSAYHVACTFFGEPPRASGGLRELSLLGVTRLTSVHRSKLDNQLLERPGVTTV